MRILHVHSGNIFGGVERILIALAGHGRVAPDCQHTFALTFHGRLEDSLCATGTPVYALPRLRLSKPWQLARARSALRTLLGAQAFDVAVVHSAWSHAAFGGLLQAAGLPLLFWLHTAAGGDSFLERAAQWRFPQHIISVSAAVDRSAATLFPGVPSDVVHTPLALEESAFSNARREEMRAALGAKENEVVIVQASRMEAWKGHAVLLDALAALPKRMNWRCWLAGGAERAEELAYVDLLKARARALKVEGRTQFLGARGDVPALLKAADIYCQANVEGEGFSIAFLEAAYAGLPIVTSALGGAFEIVDAHNGRLVPPRKVAALAAALEELIDNAALRRAMGAAGRARALERCDPERQFAALERVFRKIVARHV